MNFEKLRLSEVLMYNTVKLICRDENNKGYLGTGFIFKYFRTDKDSVMNLTPKNQQFFILL